MKKNVGNQSIGVQMVSASDGSNFTGSISVVVTKDSGVQTAGAGSAPVHEGNGYYSYSPTQAETNADHIAFTFIGTGAITATVQVYTTYPQSVDNNTILSTLPTQSYLDSRTLPSANYFDPATDTVATVTNITNAVTLPTIPTGWITSTGIAASALNGKGDWNIGKTGYSIAGTKTTLDALNDIAATEIVSAGAITTLAGAVVNVDTVDTCTSNTDMRGTDGANTVVPDNSGINSKLNAIQGATFDALTDSLEAIRNRGDSAWLTGAGGSAPTVVDIRNELDANSTKLASILADTNELQLNQGNWVTATGFSTFDPATTPVNVSKILGTAISETTAGNIATNISTFFDNGNIAATKTQDDVGTAVSGGGTAFTSSELAQLRYRLGIDGSVAVPTATPNGISTFNPSSDTVASVTNVINPVTLPSIPTNWITNSGVANNALDNKGNWNIGKTGYSLVQSFPANFSDMKISLTTGEVTVGTNNDKSGYTIAGTKTTLDSLNDVAATEIVSAGPITTSSGSVSNVLTNSDMRGTDGANTVAPDNASIAAILVDTGTSIPASISGLNDLSQADIRTSVGLAAANMDVQFAASVTATGFSTKADTDTIKADTVNILADTNELQLNQGNWTTATGFATTADILSTPLTESYANKGVEPTLTQAIYSMISHNDNFSYAGTTKTTFKLDGITTASTYTMDSGTTPTKLNRNT